TKNFINKKSLKIPDETEVCYLAVWTGLEPATSCVTGRHSNQLNYQTVRCIAVQIYNCFLFLQIYLLFFMLYFSYDRNHNNIVRQLNVLLLNFFSLNHKIISNCF